MSEARQTCETEMLETASESAYTTVCETESRLSAIFDCPSKSYIFKRSAFERLAAVGPEWAVLPRHRDNRGDNRDTPKDRRGAAEFA
jgi:hypothetical protein